MTLTWRPLRTEDAKAWSDLSTAMAAADGHQWIVSPEAAVQRLTASGFDPELDSWAVWDGDHLVAYATCVVGEEPRFDGKAHAYLSGGVHPNWRLRGIGTELIARVEERARAALREKHPDVTRVLFIESGNDQDPAITLLKDNGFVASRRFHDMERERPSQGELPDRSQPAPGIVVRPPTEADEEQTRLAHNDAFRTHWGSAPSTREEWAEEFRDEKTNLELSRIAVDGTGRVLAYSLVSNRTPERPYVELVGSRDEARGMGLGKATLSESLRAMSGNPTVARTALDVDADNPFGAARIYQDLGFLITNTWSAMEKPVD